MQYLIEHISQYNTNILISNYATFYSAFSRIIKCSQ